MTDQPPLDETSDGVNNEAQMPFETTNVDAGQIFVHSTPLVLLADAAELCNNVIDPKASPIPESVDQSNISQLLAFALVQIQKSCPMDLYLRLQEWHKRTHKSGDPTPFFRKEQLLQWDQVELFQRTQSVLQQCTPIRFSTVEGTKRVVCDVYASSAAEVGVEDEHYHVDEASGPY